MRGVREKVRTWLEAVVVVVARPEHTLPLPISRVARAVYVIGNAGLLRLRNKPLLCTDRNTLLTRNYLFETLFNRNFVWNILYVITLN